MALYSKKNRRWIWKALDRHSRRCIAWVVGHRDAATFQQLYDKLKHLKAHYFTDGWEVYRQMVPTHAHTMGKAHTVAIERDNSNTRHYLARMTRRTKMVSKSEVMVDLSLRIQYYLSIPEHYKLWQQKALSIFG